MAVMVLVMAGMHEYVSLCWTSYIFRIVMCLVFVLSVTHWHRPLAVVWVCTMAGAVVASTIVIQWSLFIMWAVRGRRRLWILLRWLDADVCGGSCRAKMLMLRLLMICVIPVGLYCLAMFRHATLMGLSLVCGCAIG